MPKHKPRPKGVDLLLRDLPTKLHARFKAYCNGRGLTMRKRIEQLIRTDIERRKVQEITKLLAEHNTETLEILEKGLTPFPVMKAKKTCNTRKS